MKKKQPTKPEPMPHLIVQGDSVRISGKAYRGYIHVPSGFFEPYGGFESYRFWPDDAIIPINQSFLSPEAWRRIYIKHGLFKPKA